MAVKVDYSPVVFEESGVWYVPDFPVHIVGSTMKLGNMSAKWEKKRGEPEGTAHKNFEKFLELIPFNPNVRQRRHLVPEHGTKIISVVKGYPVSEQIYGDGLFTQDPSQLLTLFPADCFPLVLADREGKTVLLLHVGYEGAKEEIVSKGVSLFARVAKTDKILAFLGPGLKACCSRTIKNVLRAITTSGGKVYIDLPRVIWGSFMAQIT